MTRALQSGIQPVELSVPKLRLRIDCYTMNCKVPELYYTELRTIEKHESLPLLAKFDIPAPTTSRMQHHSCWNQDTCREDQ